MTIPQLGQIAEASSTGLVEKPSGQSAVAANGAGSFLSSLSQAVQSCRASQSWQATQSSQTSGGSGTVASGGRRGSQKAATAEDATSTLSGFGMTAGIQLLLPQLPSVSVVVTAAGNESGSVDVDNTAGVDGDAAVSAGSNTAATGSSSSIGADNSSVPALKMAVGSMTVPALLPASAVGVQPRSVTVQDKVSSLDSFAKNDDAQPSTNSSSSDGHAALLHQVQQQLTQVLRSSATHAVVAGAGTIVAEAAPGGVAAVKHIVPEVKVAAAQVSAAVASRQTGGAVTSAVSTTLSAPSVATSTGHVALSNGVGTGVHGSAKASATADASAGSQDLGKHQGAAQGSTSGQGGDGDSAASQDGPAATGAGRAEMSVPPAPQQVTPTHELQQAAPAASSALPAVQSATPAATAGTIGGHDVQMTAKGAAAAQEDAAPLSAIQSAQLVQRASQAEMRVGLHSQEFGAINIRTATSGQNVSAQISLEHGDLARVLATHMPEMQARTAVEHSVELRTTGVASGMASSDAATGQQRRGEQQAAESSKSRAGVYGSQQETTSVSAVPQALISNTLPVSSGRLDLRA